MAMSRAANFGKNASTRKMTPMMIPTRRAAMPVTSASEILVEYVVFGSVPISPESRLPTPSAFKAPWTTRKSVAFCRRFDTRWMATPSPIVSIAPTIVTMTNAGSRAQNSTPGDTSNPGQDLNGTPIQCASTICCTS